MEIVISSYFQAFSLTSRARNLGLGINVNTPTVSQRHNMQHVYEKEETW